MLWKKKPLSTKLFKKLRKYHKQIFIFLRDTSSLSAKKSALLKGKQHGGFLPLLIAPLLSLLSSFAGEAIAKKIIK